MDGQTAGSPVWQALPLTDVPAALIETWLATQLGFCEPALKEQMPRHNSCSFGTELKNLVICSIKCSVGHQLVYLSARLRLLQAFALIVLTLGSLWSLHLRVCVRVQACVTVHFYSRVDIVVCCCCQNIPVGPLNFEGHANKVWTE